MRFLEKIQKLKIVDGLLVILGIGINFKDQFSTKEEIKNISR